MLLIVNNTRIEKFLITNRTRFNLGPAGHTLWPAFHTNTGITTPFMQPSEKGGCEGQNSE